MIVESISRDVSMMPPHSDLFYIGPTNMIAKEIIWNRLDDRFRDNRWKFQDYISAQQFRFSKGRTVYIIGAEKIRRIRGHKVYSAYLDEVAFFETPLTQVWRAVRPTLADLRGRALLATTPNGKGTAAHDFYLEIIRKQDWAYHHWFTSDNPGIDRQEIEDAKRELSEKDFKQEYEAEWTTFEGLAWHEFNENIHIKKQPPITPELPIILHYDFNVNPTTLVLGQRDNEMYRIKKEYSIKNSSTIVTTKNFCEEYKHLAGHVLLKIRGDSTGNSRKSNTGYADYHYIREMLSQYGFDYQYEVPGHNPAIVDRVQHCNAYLMNAKGQHRLEFDPSCVDTIKDFSSQTLEGRFPSDKNNLGHKSDAVSYGVYWDYLTNYAQRKSSSTIL